MRKYELAGTKEKALSNLSALIDEVQDFLAKTDKEQNPLRAGLLTKSLSAIYRFTSPKDPYVKLTNRFTEDFHRSRHPIGKKNSLNEIFGVVIALYEEIEAGHMDSIVELSRAETFTNMSDIASELLENNYKDAAAVIIGSTLEIHLKNLCKKADISLSYDNGKPKGPSKLNDELKHENIINSINHKQITAWIAIRNAAAHGSYNAYNIEDIKSMNTDVLRFINEFSA
ncbi:MAG: hypothetical protein HeimC3_39320 [Candidatus Heimdallarchaeota archaeon LC_3]|nr:MAG: hypothetical protein HeimC3_39320 [Candidatus Heimdallarchaeota archaeon LC_3]